MDSRTRRLITLCALGVLVVAVVVGALVNQASAAQPSSSISGARAEQELADRYTPYVVVRLQEEACGEGEPFRPISVTSVFGRDDVVLRGPDGEVVAEAPTAVDLSDLPDRGTGYYLDFPGDPLDPACDYEEWERSFGEVPPVVHARVATDSAAPDRLVLQYWFWWVYNDWNDKHEGDWEMIQLTFDATTAEEALATQPTTVAFAQHEGVQTVNWDDARLLRDGDHVAVYPGQGSHAAYFTQSQWFGKSAAAGFGCDNTGLVDGLSAELIRPSAELVDESTPWLQYDGRWGEKAPSFNNGPTGPNTKEQWDHPVTWQEAEDGAAPVALPVALSEAEAGFCTLSAAGSALFISALDAPVLVLIAVLVVVVLLILLIRSTRWRGSPVEVARERTAGQILVGPFQIVRAHAGQYWGVMLALMGLLLVSYWAQIILQRPDPTSDLTRVGAPAEGTWNTVALVVTGVITIVLTAFCSAITIGITQGLPQPQSDGYFARSVATRRGTWRALASYVVIFLCFVSIILIPLAAYLLARWAVAAPAAVVEDLPVGAAGRRSRELTRNRRWRSLAVQLGCLALGALPGPVIGAVLLLVTSLSFSIVNIVVLVTTAGCTILASIAFTLHFNDLRLRVGSDESQQQEVPA